MPSIRRSQKLFSGIDYIGNFLGEPVALGNIYKCDDQSFVLLANIKDLAPVDLAAITDTGSKQKITYTKESNVNVKIGAQGDVTVGKGELELTFAKKNSAFVALHGVTVSSLRLQTLEDELKKIWKSKRYKDNGTHIAVFQLMQAQSGTVIFSAERNNKVVLKGSADEKLSSIVKAGSGNVEFITNTKATLEIISTQPILPMFKAFYFDRRGDIEVVG